MSELWARDFYHGHNIYILLAGLVGNMGRYYPVQVYGNTIVRLIMVIIYVIVIVVFKCCCCCRRRFKGQS